MISFVARRRMNIVLTLVVAVALAAGLSSLDDVFYDTAFLSGWLLLATLVVLALFNARKKVPFLPLGTGAAWLQFHIYAGLLGVVVFCFHLDWRLPNGMLEVTLAVLLAVAFASGAGGLILSRTVPPRLTTRGDAVLFERIPALIAELREQSEALIVASVEETNLTTLGAFYMEHLAWFFRGPRNGLAHLFESDRPRRALLDEFQALERYATAREMSCLDRLREYAMRKDDLDYQYSLQATLKAWLFVHIPLTYALVLLSGLHVIVAYAFDGGAR